MSKSKAAFLTLAVALAPSMALAESSPGRDALKKFCTSDYMEHCSVYSPGGPEVEACFKVNMKKLRPDCVKAISAYKVEQKQTQKREAQAR